MWQQESVSLDNLLEEKGSLITLCLGEPLTCAPLSRGAAPEKWTEPTRSPPRTLRLGGHVDRAAEIVARQVDSPKDSSIVSFVTCHPWEALWGEWVSLLIFVLVLVTSLVFFSPGHPCCANGVLCLLVDG